MRSRSTSGDIRIKQLTFGSFKIDRNTPQVFDIKAATGWERDPSGVWVDSRGTPLKGNDLVRAEELEKHNIGVDIQNNNPSGTP